MPALSGSALLHVWEQGRNEGPQERALTILVGAKASRPGPPLSQLTVGERDSLLVALREDTFGSHVEAVVDCASCGEALELTFDTKKLAHAPPADTVHSIATGDLEVRFRLPTCDDVAASTGEADVAAAGSELLARCVIDPPAAELSDLAKDAVVERMSELDPLAALELELACPTCGHDGRAGFDIASFVWTEVEAGARRMLEDVHMLASAYGWREADVLELSAERRRQYLELVG